jgi:hypothetical protein
MELTKDVGDDTHLSESAIQVPQKTIIISFPRWAEDDIYIIRLKFPASIPIRLSGRERKDVFEQESPTLPSVYIDILASQHPGVPLRISLSLPLLP